jgi:hypothetical protein
VFQPPITFALHDPVNERDSHVLAIGMTLPDGSAVTVDWHTGHAGTVGVWSSPEAAAAVHRADLVWYGRNRLHQPPTGPPNGGLWRSVG